MENFSSGTSTPNSTPGNKPRIYGSRAFFKPFYRPEFYEAWAKQQSMFWLHFEVCIKNDKHDYYHSLTEDEREIISMTLRFFTQTDMQVSRSYIALASHFKIYEVQMTCIAFANMETIHANAYAFMVDSLGLPERHYQEFLNYSDLVAKNSFLEFHDTSNSHNALLTMAYVAVFTEGFILFSSFCLLLNMSRYSLLKGIAQITTWALRDETLHCSTITFLFNWSLRELMEDGMFSEWQKEKLLEELNANYIKALNLEIEFINMIFDNGKKTMRGLTANNVISYIKRLGEIRTKRIGMKIPDEYLYNPDDYPTWIDEMTNLREFVDFFIQRPTEYKKADITNLDDNIYDSLK